jgi:GYF domain 2
LSYSVKHGRKNNRKAESDNAEPIALADPTLAVQSDQDLWFVHINDEARGPFSIDVLRQALADGTLSKEDWVWREGLTDWIRAADEQAFIAPMTLDPRTPIDTGPRRWKVRNAFLVGMAIALVLVAGRLWQTWPAPDFPFKSVMRLAALPVILMLIAIARNVIVCRRRA